MTALREGLTNKVIKGEAGERLDLRDSYCNMITEELLPWHIDFVSKFTSSLLSINTLKT